MTRLGIIGAGTMGASIAVTMALNGFRVKLYDISKDILEDSRLRIESIINGGISRGKFSDETAQMAANSVDYTEDLDELSLVKLVVEAATESLEVKESVLRNVDKLLPKDTILSTNTSSLSINVLASFTARADRFVGLHFFNPAHIMPLIEIIPCDETSAETMKTVRALSVDLGKTAVVCKDNPGFIVNRVARPFYGEALRLLGENAANVQTIDELIRSIGLPMGPFELIDLVGSDVNLAVTQSVYNAYFQEPKYRPHPIQEKMVKSGRLGRKAGRGFYEYNS